MRFHKITLPKEDLNVSTEQREIMKGRGKIYTIYGGLNSKGNDLLCVAAITIHKIKIREEEIEFTFRTLNTKNGKVLLENISKVEYKIRKDSENNFISLDCHLK